MVTRSSLTPNHLNSLLELWEHHYEAPWSALSLQAALDNPSYHCLGVLEGSEVIGFVLALSVQDEAEIHALVVHTKYRRQGLGGQLLTHVIERLRNQGVRKIFLEVRLSNIPAQTLYMRYGFQKIGRRQNYYLTGGGNQEDALVLEKRLD